MAEAKRRKNLGDTTFKGKKWRSFAPSKFFKWLVQSPFKRKN